MLKGVQMIAQKSTLKWGRYRLMVVADHCVEVMDLVDENDQKLEITSHRFYDKRLKQTIKAIMLEKNYVTFKGKANAFAAASLMAGLDFAFNSQTMDGKSDAWLEEKKPQLYTMWREYFADYLDERAKR